MTSLFPDTRYEFQVSCFNNLGNSSSSIFSNEIQTSSTVLSLSLPLPLYSFAIRVHPLFLLGSTTRSVEISKFISSIVISPPSQDRIQSLPYRKEILKCEQDPEKCLKNQPAPMSHKSSSAGYSLATINDIAQSITLYDRQTAKVLRSFPSPSGRFIDLFALR